MPGRADFEERRERRAERLEVRAINTMQESKSRLTTAHSTIAGIPPGQPILVGHHSERRHRAALAKHDDNMRKGLDLADKAESLADRAEACRNNTAIFSDDNGKVAKFDFKANITQDELSYVWKEMFGLRQDEDEAHCKGNVPYLLWQVRQTEEGGEGRENHQDLSSKTITLFSLRDNGNGEADQGIVQLLLYEAVPEVESEIKSDLLPGSTEEILRQASRSNTDACFGEAERNSQEGDQRSGWEMRVLRGGDLRVSHYRPYKQRRGGAQKTCARITYLCRHLADGLPEGQVSNPLLQLQLRERALRALSASKVIFGRPPDHFLEYFVETASTNAQEKLEDKLKRLEQAQELMKQANAVIRTAAKKKEDPTEALLDLGFSEQRVRDLLHPRFGRPGFASYSLSNNNAEIRRVKERIKEIQAHANDVTQQWVFGPVRVVDSVEENRVQIFFTSKPSEEILVKLKSHGFKWSPSVKAWQRQRSSSAEYWAKDIIGGR